MNCSSLIKPNTTNEIWLEFDNSSIYAAKYWNLQFLVGYLLLFAFIVTLSFCLTLFWWTYDKYKKLNTLKNHSIDPVLRIDVQHKLHPNLNNTKCINLILDYANITANSKLEYANSIMISSYDWEVSSFSSLLIQFICIVSLLWLTAYIPIYHVSVHMFESYQSFVEVSCFPTGIYLCGGEEKCVEGICECIDDGYWEQYQFYPDSICNYNVGNKINEDIVFYGSLPAGANKYKQHEKCYINPENKIRDSVRCGYCTEPYSCYCYNGRCGNNRCGDSCGNCMCCKNSGGYFGSILWGFIFCAPCCLILGLFADYEIRITAENFNRSKFENDEDWEMRTELI
eukprot:100799_1